MSGNANLALSGPSHGADLAEEYVTLPRVVLDVPLTFPSFDYAVARPAFLPAGDAAATSSSSASSSTLSTQAVGQAQPADSVFQEGRSRQSSSGTRRRAEGSVRGAERAKRVKQAAKVQRVRQSQKGMTKEWSEKEPVLRAKLRVANLIAYGKPYKRRMDKKGWMAAFLSESRDKQFPVLIVHV